MNDLETNPIREIYPKEGHIFGIEYDMFMYVYIGLSKYIDSLERELISEIECPKDYPSDWPSLKSKVRFLEFKEYVINEMFTDLYICYKKGVIPLTGRDHLERRIFLIFNEYKRFFWTRITEFEKNFKKLQAAFRRKKNKEIKVMLIPQITSPVTIPLYLRFAILHRAEHKCEGCGSSIFDNPIDAYMVCGEEKADDIRFAAYCKKCKELNEQRIIPEP